MTNPQRTLGRVASYRQPAQALALAGLLLGLAGLPRVLGLFIIVFPLPGRDRSRPTRHDAR